MKEMSIEKKRNSSLEILRIICMLLIIAHHYSVHGGYEAISYENIGMARVFIQMLSMFGRMACTIFALMTGYFLIDAFDKRRGKKLVYLVIMLTIYSVVIWITVYGFKLIPLSFIKTIKALNPFLWGNWYVINYILFVLCLPFINPWIKGMKRQELRKFILVLIIVWSVIPTLTMPIATVSSFGPIGFFFVAYLVGAYIKLHHVYRNDRGGVYLGIAISMLVIMLLSVLLFDMVGYILKKDFLIVRATCFKEYNSIFALVGAVFIFLYSLTLHYENMFVNRVAESMVGVYIIHDNELFREYIWRVVSPNIKFVDFPYVHAIAKILLVFIVCLLIDIIFNETLGKVIKRYIDKNYDRIKVKITDKMSCCIDEKNNGGNYTSKE